MFPALSNRESDQLTNAGALLVNGMLSIEDAAAINGMAVVAFVAAMEDPAIQSQIETESARMKISGKLTEARALSMLDRLIVNFESQIDGMAPATATRVAEILLKISGLAEKRAAEARQGDMQKGEKFSITIIMPGDRDPIKLSRASSIIEGEAVEVEA